ncbi:MAG: hypothetical protein FJ386_01280 [Verrucomicrobia bacterium]|nr:hypothetical protein [Verrucomicrobiota bacterium]
MSLRRTIPALLRRTALGFALSAALCTFAQVKPAPSVSGVWKLAFTAPDGNAIVLTLKLKQDGSKLGGTYIARNGQEIAIDDGGTIKDGQASFNVTRERNGQKIVSKVGGKFTGDEFKGRISATVEGQDFAADIDGRREAAANATGSWKYALQISVDTNLEFTAVLKQDGDKVTGTIKVNEFDSPISDGGLKDGELSFKVVRERDGQKFTSTYTGKLSGDTIKGKITSDFGGEKRTYDWEAKRAK